MDTVVAQQFASASLQQTSTTLSHVGLQSLRKAALCQQASPKHATISCITRVIGCCDQDAVMLATTAYFSQWRRRRRRC
jgi:hypothetical protein